MPSFTALFGTEGDVLQERNFLLLLLANAIYPLGVLLVSPILESLVTPFGTDPNRIGLLISAFYAPAVFVTPITGLLVDRFGRKPLLVVGLLLFGAAGFAIASITTFRFVLVSRLLQGVGAAAILPVVITSIGDQFDGTRESTAQGLRGTVHASAGAVAPLIAGALIVLSWRNPFRVYGAAIVVALVVFLWFEEPTSPGTRSDGGSSGVERSTRRRVRLVVSRLRTRGMAATMVAIVVPAFLWTGFLTYNSFVVVQGIGGSPQVAGLLVSLGLVVGATASSQIGRLTDRLNRRAVSPIVAHLMMGVGLCTFVFAGSFPGVLAGALTLGGGFGYLVSYYRSVVSRAASEDVRGTLVGVAETVRGVGVTLPPLVMGAGIQLVSPSVGFLAAIRSVSVVVGIVGTAVGIGCILVIQTSQVSL